MEEEEKQLEEAPEEEEFIQDLQEDYDINEI